MEDSRIALPIGTALDRFIKSRQTAFPFATGELSQLLRDIALSGKVVNREINRAGLINLAGAAGSENSTGEQQQNLDVLANIRFSRSLEKGGEVCAIVSEEEDEIIEVNRNAHYVVAIDPLDGSSNIDVNVSIGTLFQFTGEFLLKEAQLAWMMYYNPVKTRWRQVIFYMVLLPCWYLLQGEG